MRRRINVEQSVSLPHPDCCEDGTTFAIICGRVYRNQRPWRAEEASMNLLSIDTSTCERAEKVVIEGICLSYDMVKGICLETMQECEAKQEDED